MASFGVSPLDPERRRLERRRALVDILQKQAMAGPQAPTMPGAQMSPYQGLAKMGEALIAALANRAQEKREKAFAGEEQKQALKTGEDIAGMLIAQSPDLGKPIDVNAPLPQAQATPMYAPEQQVSLAGTDQQVTLPPALSAAESEAMASMAPGLSIPDLRSSFASQQAQVAREKPQLDAARNALARTIAGGGAPAQFAIANQQALNQRALDVAEQKHREGVLAERQAVEDAIRESQFTRERSARESEMAQNIADREAARVQQKQQHEAEMFFKAKEAREERLFRQSQFVAASAEKERDRKAQAKRDEENRKAQQQLQQNALQNALKIAGMKGSDGKTIPANSIKEHLNLSEGLQTVTQAINKLEEGMDYGSSFARGISAIPYGGGAIANQFLNENQAKNRAFLQGISEAITRVNAGLSQTEAEQKMLNSMVPRLEGPQMDSLETLLGKLKNLQTEYQGRKSSLEQEYGSGSGYRGFAGSTPRSVSGGPKTASSEEEDYVFSNGTLIPNPKKKGGAR